MIKEKIKKLEDLSFNVNVLSRWISIIFTVITGTISLVWYASLVHSQMAVIEQKYTDQISQNVQLTKEEDRKINNLRLNQIMDQTIINNLSDKLDIAITIIQRIDSKHQPIIIPFRVNTPQVIPLNPPQKNTEK